VNEPLWISVGPDGPHIFIQSNFNCPLSLHPQTDSSLRPRNPSLVPTPNFIKHHRMYRSFLGTTDQCSWSEFPELPFIFPPSPASSNGSRGPPQMQLDLYDPNISSFSENQSNYSPNLYAPLCAAISAPPGRGDEWGAFNLSQLFSVNPGVPPSCEPASSSLPEQQFIFGDGLSPFAFNIEDLWPRATSMPPAHENPIPAPTTYLSMPDPQAPPQHTPLSSLPHPLPPRDSSTFSQNSQIDDPISLACPNPPESDSTPSDPAFPGDSPVTATPPQPRPIQRSSSRPSKKRKADQADSDDESVRAFLYFSHVVLNLFFPARKTLLQCCMMVKPESLARHLKSDGHKRNAGLPLDRPEVCTSCNIA
jgi:hypothetical protein